MHIHNSLFNRMVKAQDLEALYVETNTFRLASHIYWALWALIQVSSALDSTSTLLFFWIT